ncbi:MAG: COG1361 S-layer family protein [Nitrososphaeria archaeon]
MRNFVPAIAALALITAMMFSATPSFASSQPIIIYSNWGTIQQPVSVRPGYTNVPFTVEFQNDTSSLLYAQLNLSSTPFTNSTGGDIARSTPSTLSPATFTFILDVKSSAMPGTYSVPVELVLTSGSKYSYAVSAQVSSPPYVRVADWYWGSTMSVYPYPGYGITPLTVVVGNPDSGPIYHISVNLQLPTGLQSQLGSTVSFYISEIAPGSYEPVSSTVNITQALSPGTYYEPYTVRYMDSNGVYFTDSGTIELVIYPRTQLSVNVSPMGIVQGHNEQFRLSVKNSGAAPVYDLSTTVQAQGIELVQGNTSQISELGSGSSASFTYTVYAPQSLPAGIYPVSVVIQYESAGGTSQSSYITYVTVLSQPQEAYISIYPGSIYYMRNDSITVSVRGSNQELRNVQLRISPAQSVYISQGYGPFYLGNIEPYGEANLSLYVLPYFSQAQVYPFQLTLQYQSVANYTQIIQQTIPVFIGGIITVNFSQVQVPSAYNGSTDSVSGTVLNSGNEEAYYGTVYINSSQMGIEQSQYIGDLPTDSPTPFSFSFYVPSTIKGGTYPITLTYQYKDNLGNTYHVSYSVYVQVLSGKAPTTSGPAKNNYKTTVTILLAAVIIIIIVAVYVFLRRLRR